MKKTILISHIQKQYGLIAKKNNYLNQVNIEYLRDKEKFKFTFPFNSGDHYTTYIKDKNALEKYVEFIISSHIQ